MTLLVVTPDFASHAVPLLTLAEAWLQRGHRVVVATGPAVAPLIAAAGMEHVELIMSRGSNAGVVSTASARPAEADSLARFFAATRSGMLETLRYQASARATDLLWQPVMVARRTIAIVEQTRPDTIIVDHLAFAATIGLRALGASYTDVILGHPTALPVEGETYGVPIEWPSAIKVDAVGLASLRAEAEGASQAFTFEFERALRSLDPTAMPVGDAFSAHGDRVMYAYPRRLHQDARTHLLPPHRFLGSLARTEHASGVVADWLADDDGRPIVVVSFGTFLSARTDVLARVVASLRKVDARVALATGASDSRGLGELPPEWLVMRSIPQVALLRHAAVLVTHGGNNSITEALTNGVPLLVMPFSTDQFDGAAAIESAGAGFALDPNRSSRPLIASLVRGLLRSPPSLPGAIASDIESEPGPRAAYAYVTRHEMTGTRMAAGDRLLSPASPSDV